MKRIDSITRRDDNGGTLVMIEINSLIYARWYEENPSDETVTKDYQAFGARIKPKWKGEFLAYDQSRGVFL